MQVRPRPIWSESGALLAGAIILAGLSLATVSGAIARLPISEKLHDTLLTRQLTAVVAGLVGVILVRHSGRQAIVGVASLLLVACALIHIFPRSIFDFLSISRSVSSGTYLQLPWFGPAEVAPVARLSFIIVFAEIVAYADRESRDVPLYSLAFMILVGFAFAQSDMRISASIFCLGGAMMLTFPSGSILHAVPAVTTLVWAVRSKLYLQRRLTSFFFAEHGSQSFQITRSISAIKAGGLAGVQNGDLVKSVPLSSADFVASSILRDWGVVGLFILIILYCTLTIAAMRVVMRLPDKFESLVSVGIVIAFSGRALLHFAVNLGLLPTFGVNLPLLSYSPADFFVTMLSLGLVSAIGASRLRH